MELYSLCKKLDNVLNKDIAYSWDKVGLQIEAKQDVNSILLALECTKETIEHAIKTGSDMILSHHPLIFSPFEIMKMDNIRQSLAIDLIKNGINLYVAHTNFDKMDYGLNSYVADLLELQNIEPIFDQEGEDKGMGRIGDLKKTMRQTEFLEYISVKLEISNLRYTPVLKDEIKKIALVTGSGADFTEEAIKRGADVFLTGDIKYHYAQDSLQKGILLVDMGHYDSEKFFPDAAYDVLSREFPEEIIIRKSLETKNPIRNIDFSGGGIV